MTKTEMLLGERADAATLAVAAEARWLEARGRFDAAATRLRVLEERLVEGVSAHGRPLTRRGRAALVRETHMLAVNLGILFCEDLGMYTEMEKQEGRAARAGRQAIAAASKRRVA